MAMKGAARRLLADLAAKSRVGSCRASSGTGRVLSEEEKAAENVYIKKMEKERAEKAVSQGVNVEGGVKVSDAPGAPHSEAAKDDGAKKSRNLAVYAGIVGLIGLAYVLTRSKEPRQREKDRE